MIKSMTGYGSASLEQEGLRISVEVRSLNSKFLDTLIKTPRQLVSKEIEVKSIISDLLQRGKVNISVEIEKSESSNSSLINEKLFLQNYEILSALRAKTSENDTDIFSLALQMPDVVGQPDQDDEDNIWQEVREVITKALHECDKFRKAEGETLISSLKANINKMTIDLDEIASIDPSRVEGIMKRIEGNLRQYISRDEIDKNRFEQEAIYFLEKLDINEEKTRLRSHLDYFLEVLNSKTSQGKKLGFITQEIGREINTIGSKANNSSIQHLVVEMKEELEKIREQLLNIL